VNQGFRLLFRAESPVLPAQAEGLGNGTPQISRPEGAVHRPCHETPLQGSKTFL